MTNKVCYLENQERNKHKEMENEIYKVLVVDDIEENLSVVGNTFVNENISLTFAMNGKQAIKIAEKKQPDLILLDINMPEMDGFEVCDILKNDENTKNIPIIFLTAYSEKTDIVKGFDLGAVDYITKPFHKAELSSRVFTHLKLKYTQDLLLKKNKELTEANATKDRFFSIISHDLKSPFNTLLGFTSLLLENHTKYDEKKRGDFINNLHISAKNAYNLLENLLTWSRSQLNKIEFSPVQANIKSAVQETYAINNVAAKKKSITLLDNTDPSLYVNADRNMLNTIIRNLVSNAIKFTKKKGTVTANAIEITEDNLIEISIIDTGIGISEKRINDLFRIDKNTSTFGTENESGTGLGLILCKEFVEKQNGKIWVESELGVGTSFKFTLPKLHKAE